MIKAIERELLTEEQITLRVSELGRQITKDYRDESIVMVGILRGAVVFFADLAREVGRPVTMDFMAVSSYGASTRSSGVVKITKDIDTDIMGRHVIVVEDIIDSGLTLNFLKENLKSRGAKSLRLCVLLDKPDRRRTHVDVDYVGFTIPDEFVVGYGLDYAGMFRNLPFIGVLKEEIYTKG